MVRKRRGRTQRPRARSNFSFRPELLLLCAVLLVGGMQMINRFSAVSTVNSQDSLVLYLRSSPPCPACDDQEREKAALSANVRARIAEQTFNEDNRAESQRASALGISGWPAWRVKRADGQLDQAVCVGVISAADLNRILQGKIKLNQVASCDR